MVSLVTAGGGRKAYQSVHGAFVKFDVLFVSDQWHVADSQKKHLQNVCWHRRCCNEAGERLVGILRHWLIQERGSSLRMIVDSRDGQDPWDCISIPAASGRIFITTSLASDFGCCLPSGLELFAESRRLYMAVRCHIALANTAAEAL